MGTSSHRITGYSILCLFVRSIVREDPRACLIPPDHPRQGEEYRGQESLNDGRQRGKAILRAKSGMHGVNTEWNSGTPGSLSALRTMIEGTRLPDMVLLRPHSVRSQW